jgi:integrase
MPRKTGIPSYRNRNGRAIVTLLDVKTGRRQDVALGAWDTPESKELYHRTIATYLGSDKTLPPQTDSPQTPARTCGLTVAELVEQYADDRSRRPINDGDGYSLKLALQLLVKHYGLQPADSIGPNALRTLREAMTRAGRHGQGWSRKYITKQIAVIHNVFKWAVGHELISPAVVQAQEALESVRAGTTGFREGRTVKPVPAFLVEATLPFLPEALVAVVRLQLLTSARPSEILDRRAGDFQVVNDDVWRVELGEHKTRHLGKSRTLYFGPKAQTVLRPFVEGRHPDDYLFVPSGSVDHYDHLTYYHAVIRACRRAFPPPEHLGRAVGEIRKAWERRMGPARWSELRAWEKDHHWSPYQLRHSAATEIRRAAGVEVTSILCGHSSAKLTDSVYAERDQQAAIAVVRRIG